MCDAHQCHRVVQSKEKEVIGDLGAIADTSANPEMQNKLQMGLKHELLGTVYIRGEPDPSVMNQNYNVAKHTLLRRHACIVNDPRDGAGEGDADKAVETFLKFWNGDWSSPVVTHICGGCCSGPDEARENLFSSAIEVDLLQSRDCDRPSVDDWGTCGAASGKTPCGLLCHDILSRVFSSALPDWNCMLPLRHDDAA